MWLGLVAYFALISLRTALNYSAIRRYLKQPLIEGPPVGEQPPTIVLHEQCGTSWEKLLLPYVRQQSFIGSRFPGNANAARVRGMEAAYSYGSISQLLRDTGHQLRAGGFPTLLGMMLSILAVPCAIFGLLTGSLPFELAALVTWVISFSEMALWQFIFQAPIACALLQPLAAVLAWAALIRAAKPA